MASLVVVPAPAAPAHVNRSLFDLEEGLMALLDTAEAVPEEQWAEFQEDLADALTKAVAKRDRVGQFLVHLESQIAAAATEIERLRARKASYEGILDRMQQYVVGIIEGLGTDAKGKLKKLEGSTVTFQARGQAAAVEVTDETLLPASCQTATVRMRLALWSDILDSVDFDLRTRVLEETGKPKLEPSKTAIKQAIEAAVGKVAIDQAKAAGDRSLMVPEVPGAQLALNRHYLVRS